MHVVVNASGALQDGARDSLNATHEHAIAALINGIGASSTLFIRISAAGVSTHISKVLTTTKEGDDAALMTNQLDWIVLRPTVVLGRAAFGGTALLDAAAAIPLIGLTVPPNAPVQTVALDYLATFVVQA